MRTLLIADLHLSAQQPLVTAGFLRFLQQQANRADALYILGDLFEVWVGDDAAEPLHHQVAQALQSLHQAGVRCYFIHGNRDFLLAEAFAKRCQLTLLPAEQVIELYGRKILIMHGDTLCIDDHAYQKFRRRMHTRWLQKLFLALPLRWRLQIAAGMRARSQQDNQYKPATIMDVNAQAVVQTMMQHNVHWLIHGHTHRPAVHPLTLPSGDAQRIVLGDWHDSGSMVQVTPQAVELLHFALDGSPC
ncbi:UDP-2,3-diacylglucosamine diphosphatase [Serratia microhaemolytica]|uniref:UDP-2,3-diacylglucosamine diphosphatase n=1 Tax=Serratia microhaemolytica TaxID=2675110 RepID=UPI000FDF1ACE|nr:UDP-2,3-diacylglucosamine diphosphatase [Serratia microhaemolytica]